MKTNFNSQICTTREQSLRLMALGLKKETADCALFLNGNNEFEQLSKFGNWEKYADMLPAWSLHRLLMMTTSKSKVILIRCESDLFDVIIQRIERDIKVGYFSKEFLEEK